MTYYAPGGHAAGMLKSQTGPTGKNTFYDYNDRGQLTFMRGDVPYPQQWQYNQFGDRYSLSTYRGGIGWSGSSWPSNPGTADVTQWFYDEATGLLTNKTDAAAQAVTFIYYNTHQLQTRVWARGVPSTNIYRANGDFVGINYSDGTTVNFTDGNFHYLNRLFKPDAVIDNAGTAEFTYDHAGRMVGTTYTAGLLAGITVTNRINGVYGRDLLQVLSSNATPSTIYSANYGYDSYGRMGSVSSGVYSAIYGYVPNSDLLQSTTCENNGATVLTTARTWDYGYRLRTIANVANGATVTSHSYLYDSLDRRIQATLEDNSIWKYSYNDRNELVGAHRFWSDWTPVAGQQYGYNFDNIGNRNTASSGGDTNGANLRTTSYSINSLNEYTSINTPGYMPILGAALAYNNVTVNGGTADRKSEYFHDEISVANGSGPVWQTVSATSGSGMASGGLAFPASSQTLTYDADGNLTFDGTWTYEWDCENRLGAMSMTNVSGIANSNRLRLEFAYDFQGRRMSKTVKSWNGSGFSDPVATLFAYDGWNLVSTLTTVLTSFMNFVWGLDLSGAINGAGGVGGLVLSSCCGGTGTNCFLSYDGSGNVTALVDAAGVTEARYEFSPFGALTRAGGALAQQNPFRFSTKYWDQESGLVYYSYRFYSPATGRWINRDPLEERGGLNLLVFVLNHPINCIDSNGRDGDEISLLGAMGTQAWIGALSGGAISGAMATIKHMFLHEGNWADIGQEILTGMATGALLGPLGKVADAIQTWGGFGPGMVGTELVSGLSRGIQGMMGKAASGSFKADIFGNDKDIRELMKSPSEQLGIGFAVGIVAGMAESGVRESGTWGESTADDRILDFSTDAAAEVGVDAAESIWSTATQVSEQIEKLR